MKISLVQEPPLIPEAVEAAIAVLRSGRVTQGEKVAEFEAAFAAMHGYPADRAVFCNSGSSANLLAVTAMDLKPGQEVIVPAVTWPTQVWPIVQCGGVPVLHDVNPETLGSAEWTWRGSPKMFTIHCLGNASTVVLPESMEDCCEALAATMDGRHVGTFGRFGTFSFYISHHMTTVEGGMVLCRDAQDADRLRLIRNHGLSRHLSTQARLDAERANPDIDPRFLFLEPGYNLRGTDVAAAMGLAQMPFLDSWAARRREIAAFWTESLDRDLFQPIKWAPGAVPFAFPLVCREHVPRRTLVDFLENKGVETRPLLAGNLARQPAMKKVRHRIAGPLTGADYLHDHALYVGLHPGLTDAQVQYLPQILKDFKENLKC